MRKIDFIPPLCFAVTLAIGVFIVPKLLNQYTAKIYKSKLRNISIDNLEPIIIRKEHSNGR